MARKWTAIEEKRKYGELYRLYVQENKTIGEISPILGIIFQVAPANPKHVKRFEEFEKQIWVGRPVGGGGWL